MSDPAPAVARRLSAVYTASSIRSLDRRSPGSICSRSESSNTGSSKDEGNTRPSSRPTTKSNRRLAKAACESVDTWRCPGRGRSEPTLSPLTGSRRNRNPSAREQLKESRARSSVIECCPRLREFLLERFLNRHWHWHLLLR